MNPGEHATNGVQNWGTRPRPRARHRLNSDPITLSSDLRRHKVRPLLKNSLVGNIVGNDA